MKTAHKTIRLETTAGTDVLDLTPDVLAFVRESGVHEGILVVFVPGSTASVTTIELESGVLEDLRRAIERIAPEAMHYDHDARWGDGNGYSHVRSALLGPSISVPIREGAPALGTWQQVVLCDFDNRARTRDVMLQAIGA